VDEGLDYGVDAGEEQDLMVRIVPAHHEGWLAVGATDLDDLAVSIRLVHVMSTDPYLVANMSLHVHSLSSAPAWGRARPEARLHGRDHPRVTAIFSTGGGPDGTGTRISRIPSR
jgi:hypothetical protein